ncbi:nucleoside kinase [Dysgonomonas sp. 216]|uniref:nucleoside kinase n=1 Tax=Dysgonomonas sp. 216 TaxID=2302934 RepID=UPI0013D26E4F|nr:nucleoside kinase [Dysgonomonas sp. 216]NDW18357.1 nucleoside kinase [Dysgonomonas sp. 216]NDW18725.1 nucleoside kinase [Dysgonomonas sp. 216]
MEKISVFCKNTNTYMDVPAGSSLLEIKELFGVKKPFIISNAKVNNKTESLHFRVYNPKSIEFIDISESSGMRSYVRALCFIMAKAVYDIYPNATMDINHPVSKGYYCTITRNGKLLNANLDTIKKRMNELIAQDIPFIPFEDETVKVVEMFRKCGFEDKALLLETSGMLYSKYHKIDDYVDYFYGSLAASSGCLNMFDLMQFDEGFLLRIPNRENPVDLEPIINQQKMHNIYNEQSKMLGIINLRNVGDLNKVNEEGMTSGVIKVSEALQEKTIADIASQISARYKNGVRVVLVAGPSSSGKTTFRKRLEVQLMTNLLKPVGLSLDDYFVDREHTPKDENGNFDFESLYALDLDLFNSDVKKLLQGEEVSIPSFNFTTGKREYKGHTLKIDKHSILVIEGIHGLNPELTRQIDDSSKFMIYVSALTAISLDNHNWIPTTDNRLLRRMVRDYKYRNYSPIDTLSRWGSVRKGEEKWIFPYQENADVMFNSAMIYELAALRRYAEPILLQVPKNVPEYAEAYRLLKFLGYFNYINDRELPPTSLLREFLGGSSFKY